MDHHLPNLQDLYDDAERRILDGFERHNSAPDDQTRRTATADIQQAVMQRVRINDEAQKQGVTLVRRSVPASAPASGIAGGTAPGLTVSTGAEAPADNTSRAPVVGTVIGPVTTPATEAPTAGEPTSPTHGGTTTAVVIDTLNAEAAATPVVDRAAMKADGHDSTSRTDQRSLPEAARTGGVPANDTNTGFPVHVEGGLARAAIDPQTAAKPTSHITNGKAAPKGQQPSMTAKKNNVIALDRVGARASDGNKTEEAMAAAARISVAARQPTEMETKAEIERLVASAALVDQNYKLSREEFKKHMSETYEFVLNMKGNKVLYRRVASYAGLTWSDDMMSKPFHFILPLFYKQTDPGDRRRYAAGLNSALQYGMSSSEVLTALLAASIKEFEKHIKAKAPTDGATETAPKKTKTERLTAELEQKVRAEIADEVTALKTENEALKARAATMGGVDPVVIGKAAPWTDGAGVSHPPPIAAITLAAEVFAKIEEVGTMMINGKVYTLTPVG